MTFLPLQSASETAPPPCFAAVKSGAGSPSFNFSSSSFVIFRSSWIILPCGSPHSRGVMRGRGTGGAGVELAHAIQDVDDSRPGGGERRTEGPNQRPGCVPLQQRPQNEGHLQHAGGLANVARPRLHPAARI